MKKIILSTLLVFLLILPSSVSAEQLSKQALKELILVANIKFDEGNFGEALSLYQKAYNAGAINGHILYNIGNCNFRLGRYGQAIASYRKALLILPKDPDILANLELSRETVSLPRAPSKPAPSLFLYGVFNDTQVISLGISFYILFWVLVATYPKIRNKRVVSLAFFCAVISLTALLSYFFSGQSYNGEKVLAFTPSELNRNPAVITKDEVNLHIAPGEDKPVSLILKEGSEVLSGNLSNEWVEVVAVDGRIGWVKNTEIEIIR